MAAAASLRLRLCPPRSLLVTTIRTRRPCSCLLLLLLMATRRAILAPAAPAPLRTSLFSSARAATRPPEGANSLGCSSRQTTRTLALEKENSSLERRKREANKKGEKNGSLARTSRLSVTHETHSVRGWLKHTASSDQHHIARVARYIPCLHTCSISSCLLDSLHCCELATRPLPFLHSLLLLLCAPRCNAALVSLPPPPSTCLSDPSVWQRTSEQTW